MYSTYNGIDVGLLASATAGVMLGLSPATAHGPQEMRQGCPLAGHPEAVPGAMHLQDEHLR